MYLMKSLVWNYRTIPLSLIAAIGAMIALLTLSPSLAQGQANGGPATKAECREELTAGRAVLCTANSFAVQTTLPDGGYHINWSEWASRHSNVERYTVTRLRFLYRDNFVLEADGTAVNSWDYTIPDVNSCFPWRVEDRWAWSCTGITNVREDPSGVSTSVEMLDNNLTSTYWTGSLAAPGRKHDTPVRALRIPGNRDEEHADNPESHDSRLTQQQVDDGTQDLLSTEVEMHLYLITAHFDDNTTRYGRGLITGAPFADRE